MIERIKVVPYNDIQVVVQRIPASLTKDTAQILFTFMPSELGITIEDAEGPMHTITMRVYEGADDGAADEVGEGLWADATSEDFTAMMLNNFVETQRMLEQDKMNPAQVAFTHKAPKTLQ